MKINLFEEFVSKKIEDTRLQKTLTLDEERDTLAELNEMTLGQLERIEDYAEMIADRMEKGQGLESWMYAEITQALNGLNSVHDVMDGTDGVKENESATEAVDEVANEREAAHSKKIAEGKKNVTQLLNNFSKVISKETDPEKIEEAFDALERLVIGYVDTIKTAP